MKRRRNMKALMYGAGNIGRGFIAQLFCESGYHTTFVDVVDAVVAQLNERGEYPLYVTRDGEYERQTVTDVSAVDGMDPDAVAAAIAEADIMATAVGVNILKFIAEPISRGVKERMRRGAGPLDVIVCENKIDANVYLHDLIALYLDAEEKRYFDANFGFVEASIGRMVPATPADIKEKEPLAVCVEPYNTLPVDRAAFKGNVPKIAHLLPYNPFELYIERKLYMHNMSHAVCAYLGALFGYEYIWQAADDKRIRYIALAALCESASALSAYHKADVRQLTDHAFDLLSRYDNKLLGDTVARVGRDTVRKLSALDRIPGALKRAAGCGVSNYFIVAGLAAGLLFAPEGDDPSLEVAAYTRENGVAAALAKYSDVTDPDTVALAERMYGALAADPSSALDLIISQKI